MTLQSNPSKKEIRTNQRIGVPGVGEVGRRAAKAAWLATKAFPKAEERMDIDDLPDEITIAHDWTQKVHDRVGEVPDEEFGLISLLGDVVLSVVGWYTFILKLIKLS